MTQTPSAALDYRQRQREETRLHVLAPLFVAVLDGVKTPEQILLEREQAERLDRLIDQLKPPRLGLAVRYYYGIRCEPGTLEQVAQKFGVTRERIRQILNKAIRILRRWILKQENPKWLRQLEARESAELQVKNTSDRAACIAERMLNEEVEREELLARRAKLAKSYFEETKRQAQRNYDYCYVEAHRLNELWELELERREDERCRKVRMAERRLQAEYNEAHRLNELWEVELKRRASRHKGKRDWLLVGTSDG